MKHSYLNMAKTLINGKRVLLRADKMTEENFILYFRYHQNRVEVEKRIAGEEFQKQRLVVERHSKKQCYITAVPIKPNK